MPTTLPNTGATTGLRSSAARNFGLKQVYPDPEDSSATNDKKIDVIALHGLDAESPKTWLAWEDEQNPKSRSVFWLAEEHMLPSALPEARILTYDWNANYDNNASNDRFLGHADTLLDRLYMDRKEKERLKCPIIFIASCFSGLLLAKALVRATDQFHRRYSKLRDILFYTIGVAFLGTPFQGSWSAGYTAAHLRIAVAIETGGEYSKELVEYLKMGTPSAPSPLDEVVQRFTELIAKEAFNIVCFYETLPTDFSAKLQRLPEGYRQTELDKDGHGIVVPLHSACLQGVERVGLDVRHNMMHKFNHPDNDGYRRLCTRLAEFAEEAEEVLRKKQTAAQRWPHVDQPETPPNPSSIVPFGRDADFVDRGVIFDQIQQKSGVPGSRTALVGLGGVGKSQLAIEFAYRTREQSPETWVFWIHASNAARFEQSYRDIANFLKIAGRQNPKANIFQLVHDWLRDERKGKWVLILDNVDDAGFLVEARDTGQDGQANSLDGGDVRPLVAYLPQCQNGSILVTTRNREAALKLVEQRDIIAVDPMDEADALALLEKKLGKQGDSDAATELATALEFMPLAIVQAAAYISQRAPRCSVRQYLKEFRKSDRKRASLLDFEGGQLRRDRDAKSSVIITWQISFDHIRHIRPSAADLLSLMSFFDRQGIPKGLLRRREENGDDQQNEVGGGEVDNEVDDGDSSRDEDASKDGDDEFEDDISTLRSYSFISVTANGSSFEMHGLVQLAMRKWLEAHGQQERWKRQFIRSLCNEFPVGEYENWARCQVLFPHAKSAVAQKPEEPESLIDWASLLYKAAWYALSMGNGTDAERMAVQSMKTWKKILDQEDKNMLSAIVLVGSAYRLRGRWKEAEELEVQVMETSSRVLGAEHPDTLTSMGNLASTFWNQGRWKEAEELEVQVMETSSRVLGAEHPDTLTSMANLASTFWNQGRWKEAEELFVQVMETSSRVLGAEHPSTLTSMANLASTFWNQGRWKEAEELEVQVMETRKRVLGAEHPSTLTSMANLAFTWKGQGRDVDAITLMEDCVRLRGRVIGNEHPDFVLSSKVLAEWRSENPSRGKWLRRAGKWLRKTGKWINHVK